MVFERKLKGELHEKYEKNRNFSLVRIKELEYMS